MTGRVTALKQREGMGNEGGTKWEEKKDGSTVCPHDCRPKLRPLPVVPSTLKQEMVQPLCSAAFAETKSVVNVEDVFQRTQVEVIES
jgi:hypothetical protein